MCVCVRELTKKAILDFRQVSLGYSLSLQLSPEPGHTHTWHTTIILEYSRRFRTYLETVSGASPSPVVLTTITTTGSSVTSNYVRTSNVTYGRYAYVSMVTDLLFALAEAMHVRF